MSEVTELLEKARAGEDGAWDRAVALVYQDLKRIARGVLGGGGSATLDAWRDKKLRRSIIARIFWRWRHARCVS
jgi:predicted kinase